jgi:hypothetical protein
MPSLDGASPGPTRGSGIGSSSSSSSAAAAASPGNVYDGSSSSSSQFYIPEAPTATPTAYASPDPYVPPVDMYNTQQQHSTGSTRGSSTTLPSVRNDGKWLVYQSSAHISNHYSHLCSKRF